MPWIWSAFRSARWVPVRSAGPHRADPAESNYYPSLIQLFCRQLLNRQPLSSSGGSALDPARTPPYPDRPRDVEDAYADPEPRKQIYDRFRWTLGLDNSYRVIALCLALETLENPTGTAEGFTLREIREWALSTWPQGFADSQTNDAFRSLLDEMCELGVLRPREGGRYSMAQSKCDSPTRHGRAHLGVACRCSQGEPEDRIRGEVVSAGLRPTHQMVAAAR